MKTKEEINSEIEECKRRRRAALVTENLNFESLYRLTERINTLSWVLDNE